MAVESRATWRKYIGPCASPLKKAHAPCMERSHMPAPNVTRHSQRVANWRYMRGPTQEKSHFIAPHVTRHSTRTKFDETWEDPHRREHILEDKWKDTDCRKVFSLIRRSIRRITWRITKLSISTHLSTKCGLTFQSDCVFEQTPPSTHPYKEAELWQ